MEKELVLEEWGRLWRESGVGRHARTGGSSKQRRRAWVVLSVLAHPAKRLE